MYASYGISAIFTSPAPDRSSLSRIISTHISKPHSIKRLSLGKRTVSLSGTQSKIHLAKAYQQKPICKNQRMFSGASALVAKCQGEPKHLRAGDEMQHRIKDCHVNPHLTGAQVHFHNACVIEKSGSEVSGNLPNPAILLKLNGYFLLTPHPNHSMTCA